MLPGDQIDGFRPVNSRYNAPIPIPKTDPGDTPGSSVTLSCEWWSYVLGALMQLEDQGIWDTNDKDEMLATLKKVYNLWDIVSAGANSGICALMDIECAYDFTVSEAAPWVLGPTPDMSVAPSWSDDWIGGYNLPLVPTTSQIVIQADFYKFRVKYLWMESAVPGQQTADWGIRVYDHDLNLLLEVPQNTTGDTLWTGELDNAERIMFQSWINLDFIEGIPTTPAKIHTVAVRGDGIDITCAPPVPIGDPPHHPNWVHTFYAQDHELSTDWYLSDDYDPLTPIPWGEWQSGNGYATTLVGPGSSKYRLCDIRSSVAVDEMVRFTIWFDREAGNQISGNYAFAFRINGATIHEDDQPTFPASPWQWTGSTAVTLLEVITCAGAQGGGVDPGGHVYIQKIQIEGTGTDPYVD